MAFQQIDDVAWGDDKPLDAALLQDIYGNVQEARAVRTRAGAWGATYSDLPRLCSGVHKAVVPFLWWLDPHVTELTVRVQHQPAAQTVSGFTLGVSISDIQTGMRYVPGNADDETQIGSATTGTVTTTFTLDSDALADVEPGWCLVFLEMLSDEGTTADVHDGLGAKKPDQVLNWERAFIVLKGGNSAYSGDEVPCALIEIYDVSEAATLYPGKYQVLRVNDFGGDQRVYVYPFLPETSAEATQYNNLGDYARVTPLGYTDLISVEIEATDVQGLDDPGASLDAGAPTRAPIASQLYRDAEEQFRRATATHHIGPQADRREEDPDFAGEALDKLSNFVDLAAAWTNFAEAQIGPTDTYKPYNGAPQYTRTAYEAVAVVLLQYYEAQGREARPWSLDLRASCIDPDRSSNTVDGQTLTLGSSPDDAFLAHGSRGFRHSPEALFREVMPPYLAGFSVAGNNAPAEYSTLRAHALRGVWPVPVWGCGHFVAVPLSMLDTEKATTRYLRLQVRAAGGELEDLEGVTGARYGFPIRFHCLGWGAVTRPVSRTDAEVLGVEV